MLLKMHAGPPQFPEHEHLDFGVLALDARHDAATDLLGKLVGHSPPSISRYLSDDHTTKAGLTHPRQRLIHTIKSIPSGTTAGLAKKSY
jgi:hypothetical protein